MILVIQLPTEIPAHFQPFFLAREMNCPFEVFGAMAKHFFAGSTIAATAILFDLLEELDGMPGDMGLC